MKKDIVSIKTESKIEVTNTSENGEYQFIADAMDRQNVNNIPSTNETTKKKTKLLKLGKKTDGKSLKHKPKKNIEPFECNRCGKLCTNKRELAKHLENHDKEIHTCTKCDRAFASKNSLAYHMKSHAGIQYECDICNRKFNDKSNMKKHRNIHLGIKKYKCTVCPKRFSDSSLFKLHLNQHAGVRYKCEFCEKSFSFKTVLKSHIQTRHFGIKPSFPCLKCSESFVRKTDLQEHANMVHLDSKYECDICQKVFYTKNKLKDHIITHPEMHLKCSICNDKFTSIYLYQSHVSRHSEYISCAHCPKQFKGRSALKDHLNQYAKKVCKTCGQLFSTKNSLRKHRALHQASAARSGNKPFARKSSDLTVECDFCGRKLRRKCTLINHIFSEHLRTLKSCDLCDFTSYKLSCMRKHNKNHPNVQYLCKYCPIRFKSSGRFKAHLKKHFDVKLPSSESWKIHVKEFIQEKKFKCNSCGLAMSDLDQLRNHINTKHLNFKCLFCEQEFSTNYSLKNHTEKTHEGILYECSTCSKRYINLSSLRKHIRTTHGEKHKCPHCGKEYVDKRFLMNHLRSHEVGFTKFKCEFCKKSFSSKRTLTIHIKKKHL